PLEPSHAWPKTSSPGDRPPRCPDPPTDCSESVTALVSNPTGSDPLGRRRGGADPNTGHPHPMQSVDRLEDLPSLRGRGLARPAGTTPTNSGIPVSGIPVSEFRC